MNKVLQILLIGALSIGSIAAKADVVTGGLSYNDVETHLITGSNGLTYVGWNEAAELTYAETLAATQEGGAYAGFHIANLAEAQEFFSLATGFTMFTPGSDELVTISNGSLNDRFGSNMGTSHYSMAWFIDDVNPREAGYIQSDDYSLKLTVDSEFISETDEYSAYGMFGGTEGSGWNITWLLVSDDVSESSCTP